jgi:hypothetical protein
MQFISQRGSFPPHPAEQIIGIAEIWPSKIQGDEISFEPSTFFGTFHLMKIRDFGPSNGHNFLN